MFFSGRGGGLSKIAEGIWRARGARWLSGTVRRGRAGLEIRRVYKDKLNKMKRHAEVGTFEGLPRKEALKKGGKYAALFPEEELVPKEMEVLIGELDRQYELQKKRACVALQDPDVILYESLVQYRMKSKEIEFLRGKEVLCAESIARLREAQREVQLETEREFTEYFKVLPRLTKRQRREYRQNFLDEMGGQLSVYAEDAWKRELLLPEHDLEKNPMSVEEKWELFFGGGGRREGLYEGYERLELEGAGEDAVDRVLAHLEMRRKDGEVEKLKEKEEEAGKKLEEWERRVLYEPERIV